MQLEGHGRAERRAEFVGAVAVIIGLPAAAKDRAWGKAVMSWSTQSRDERCAEDSGSRVPLVRQTQGVSRQDRWLLRGDADYRPLGR